LVAAVKAVQNAGMQAYADVVLNHKDGGDNPETVKALPFRTDNRNYPSGDWQQIEIYTNFTFPGRNGKHSSMEWHWWHFDAVNHRKDRLGRQ
jgi:alpha-amylase